MANKAVVDWFDGLEAILEAESKLSGLLGHGSTIGQAREFVVARILKTILSPAVHIGSGKVIDSSGAESRQIDIIIYDSRFPLMKVEGGGLYFVEGVLATVEVKSTIDSRKTLAAALDNCKSVLDLNPNGEYPEECTIRTSFYMNKGGLRAEQAAHRFAYRLRPATYIFGFRSSLSFDATCTAIQNWCQGIGCRHSPYFPLLPRVITAGEVVGFVNDGRINLNSSAGTNHVMALFQTSRRFRWFAIHIMDVVSMRLGLRNFAEWSDYRISDYYPFEEYMSEITGSNTKFISFSPPQ